jgi:porphobilinogen synthase
MVQDVRVTSADLIYPIFVSHGQNVCSEIESMPGQSRLSVDRLPEQAQEIFELGIPAVILFGIPKTKDAQGSDSFDGQGIIQQATQAIKAAVPDLVVIADTCLCEYTDHGHCGVVADGSNALPAGYVLNDETLSVLNRIAVSQAKAGADIIAPSGMMDGMVASIRGALDGKNLEHIPIMSYSVKYASAYYGPFRDAADGAPKFGDRRTHQMDPATFAQALAESDLDVQQGADFLMVKPALAYLDIIAKVKDRHPGVPMVGYNVSGEYSMIKAAAAAGFIDEQAVVMETLTGIKRAGADSIITYHAKDACRWLQSNS